MNKKQSFYLKFINQALGVARAIPKYFSKYSNKIYDNHQKLILLVLKQKLRTTYRDLIDLLDITNIPRIINLTRIPHFTTLIRFSKKLSPILARKILAYSCRISKPSKLKLGVDATGLFIDTTSKYYANLHGVFRKRRYLVQVTAAGLMDNLLITAVRINKYNTTRNNNFLPVLRDSSKLARVEYVAADKGYDSKYNHAYVLDKLHAISCIKVRDKHLHPEKSPLRKYVLDTFNEQLYHQRSKIECIFSMIKRKYGSSIRGKSKVTQIQEAYCKVLTHNIDRLCVIINYLLGMHQSWKR